MRYPVMTSQAHTTLLNALRDLEKRAHAAGPSFAFGPEYHAGVIYVMRNLARHVSSDPQNPATLVKAVEQIRRDAQEYNLGVEQALHTVSDSLKNGFSVALTVHNLEDNTTKVFPLHGKEDDNGN